MARRRGGPSGWQDWRRHNPSDLSGLPRWGPSQFRLVPSHQQYCQKVDIVLKTFLNADSSPPSPMPQTPPIHNLPLSVQRDASR